MKQCLGHGIRIYDALSLGDIFVIRKCIEMNGKSYINVSKAVLKACWDFFRQKNVPTIVEKMDLVFILSQFCFGKSLSYLSDNYILIKGKVSL